MAPVLDSVTRSGRSGFVSDQYISSCPLCSRRRRWQGERSTSDLCPRETLRRLEIASSPQHVQECLVEVHDAPRGNLPALVGPSNDYGGLLIESAFA